MKEFDEKLIRQFITYMINFTFIVWSYIENLCFMFITKLSNHSIIIDKSWMNKYEVILNMLYDKLIFVFERYTHWNALKIKDKKKVISFTLLSSLENFMSDTVIESVSRYKILKREAVFYFQFTAVIKNSKFESKSLNIAQISAEFYHKWIIN